MSSINTSLRSFARALFGNWLSGMSGPLSVPFAGLALLVEDGRASLLFGVLAFLCIAVAAFVVWKKERARVVELEERIRPKIRLDFGMAISGCVVPTTFNHGLACRYFRLKAEANAYSAVPGCTGRLLSIKRNGVMLFDSEPLLLTFSPGAQADTLAKEIRDGVPEFLDVLFLCAKGIILTTPNMVVPNSVNFQTLLAPQGLYTFDVVVSSSAAKSVRYELNLDWRGNWQTDAATGRAIE